jgi:TrbL/VirB6 plasmid conjugal transfer protein
MGATSMVDLFAHINEMMSADASFFMSAGRGLFDAFIVVFTVWFGIQWALRGGMDFERFSTFIMTIASGYAMIHFYSTPLGIFGGKDFHHLVTDEGKYLANALNDGTTDNLFTALDGFIAGVRQPGISSVFNVAEVAEWVIIFIAIVVMEAAVYVVIAWGYIAMAIAVLLGPICIPFFIFPAMEWIFWGWLKSLIQYSFYPVVANALLFVFGKLMIGYINDNAPRYDGANQFALILPMLIMMVAFTFGVIKVPGLVSNLFSGRAGDSVIPSI